jgi:hypothetical protein
VLTREQILEDFVGDVDYHPKRGAVYLLLGAAALCVWIYSSPEHKLDTIPLLFAFGSLPLLLKAVFLFRKSSEGLALTVEERSQLSAVKPLPPVTALLAQIVQDFGAGAVTLGPVLHTLKRIDPSWDLPIAEVFFSGLALCFAGWFMRHLISSNAAG